MAASLPGKTLAVGIAIWHLVGLNKTSKIKLTSTTLRKVSVGRKAGYAAIARLEQAGLVVVQRRRGACPIVQIERRPFRQMTCQ